MGPRAAPSLLFYMPNFLGEEPGPKRREVSVIFLGEGNNGGTSFVSVVSTFSSPCEGNNFSLLDSLSYPVAALINACMYL